MDLFTSRLFAKRATAIVHVLLAITIRLTRNHVLRVPLASTILLQVVHLFRLVLLAHWQRTNHVTIKLLVSLAALATS